MKYYVYQHKRLKDGSIFYIGKGTNGRLNSDGRRNQHWHNIVKKDGGFTAEIIKDNLTNEEALKLEVKVISEIGLTNLTNMTEGGAGGDTRTKFTDEQYEEWLKNKSEAQTGKTSYWKGKKRPKHSKRIKELIDSGHYKGITKGVPKSDEHKISMSESAVKRKRKIVKCDRCGKEVPDTHLSVHKKGRNCLV